MYKHTPNQLEEKYEYIFSASHLTGDEADDR